MNGSERDKMRLTCRMSCTASRQRTALMIGGGGPAAAYYCRRFSALAVALLACLLWSTATGPGTTLAAALTTAQQEEVGLTGSGSGEDDTEPDCVLPMRVPDPPYSTNEEGLAVLEMRCHLACVETLLGLDKLASLVGEDALWPTIQDSVLIEEGGCELYQKVRECRNGCSKHRGQSQGLPCESLCYGSCVQECGNHTSCLAYGSTCLRKCDEDACLVGCEVYEDVMMSLKNGTFPENPSDTGRPILRELEGSEVAGVYRVDLSQATPASGSVEVATYLTGFVFEVIQTDSSNRGFYWLNSEKDLLNLEAFACIEAVLLRFTAVNKFGEALKKSRSAIINVYGDSRERHPLNPSLTSLGATVTWLDRSSGQLALKITWEAPSDHDLLTHYIAHLWPQEPNEGCGSSKGRQTVVDKTSTHVTFSPQSPWGIPRAGCSYYYNVTSHPQHASAFQGFNTRIVTIPDTDPGSIPLSLSCTPVWNEDSRAYTVHMQWVLRDYQPLIDSVQSYEVSVFRDEVRLQSNYSITNPGTSSGWVITDELPSHNYSSYTIEFSPVRVDNDSALAVPSPVFCFIDADPPPALETESVDAKLVVVGGGGGGGDNQFFTVRLTLELLSDGETLTEEGGGGGTVRLIQLRVESEGIVVSLTQFDVEGNSATTDVQLASAGRYIMQLRSMSRFGPSSRWSKPICVLLVTTEDTTFSSSGSDSTDGGCFRIIAPTTTTTTDALITTEVPEPTGSDDKGGYWHGIPIPLSAVCSIAVAMVTALGLVCFMGACFSILIGQRRHRARKNDKARKDSNGGIHKPYIIAENRADEWELNPNQVILDERVGEGEFGDVYKGRVRGLGFNDSKLTSPKIQPPLSVSINLLKWNAQTSETESFLKHIEVMKSLSARSHPNLLNILGCVTVRSPTCLVTEQLKYGDLITYLETSRHQLVAKSLTTGSGTGLFYSPYLGVSTYAALGELTSSDLIHFATQIASGMEYLCEKGIVHCDLACRNIQVGEDKNIKICLTPTKDIEWLYVDIGRGPQPVRWMSVESIADGAFNSQTDVWAYGVTLWEIVTLGGFPYAEIGDIHLLSYLQHGQRLAKSKNCSQQLYEIMVKCWHSTPSQRPTFGQLQQSLQSLLTSSGLDDSQIIRVEVDARYSTYIPTDTYAMTVNATATTTDSKTASTISTASTSFVNSSALSPTDSASGSEGVGDKVPCLDTGKDKMASAGLSPATP